MPTYVSLCNWTNQGIKNFKDTLSRAKEAEDAMAKLGVRFQSLYWTVGPYDLVAIVDADDEERHGGPTRARRAGQHPNHHHGAYDADRMNRIVGKLG